jgi:hypothetical protein
MDKVKLKTLKEWVDGIETVASTVKELIEQIENHDTEDQRYIYFDDGLDDRGRTKYSYRPSRRNYIRVGDHHRSAQSPVFGYRRYYRDPSF